MLVSHSQPLLSHHHHNLHVRRVDNNGSDDDEYLSSGSGGDLRLPPITSRRPHSYDDLVQLSARNDDVDHIDAFFKRCHTTPGYVSFEDVIDSEEFREGSSRRCRPEAGISDPLVRATSRLYARGHPGHRRRKSPGPLGTRRGGVMYRFVKKYVCPCLAFVPAIFGKTG
uniref:Uncharacterized protein n=1 Tax=Leersia perrieri TaxID=77586 RepID=A0A0D9W4R9_9ORYZ